MQLRAKTPLAKRFLGRGVVFCALIVGFFAEPCYSRIVVIGDPAIGQLDSTTLGRVYTGRTVQVAGIQVKPFNLKAGDTRRSAFLRAVLQQSDDDYVAYWIVRHAIGKGNPPVEMDSPEAIIDAVTKSSGAIGYVDESDVIDGITILLTLP
jgi:hypothetical protein